MSSLNPYETSPALDDAFDLIEANGMKTIASYTLMYAGLMFFGSLFFHASPAAKSTILQGVDFVVVQSGVSNEVFLLAILFICFFIMLWLGGQCVEPMSDFASILRGCSWNLRSKALFVLVLVPMIMVFCFSFISGDTPGPFGLLSWYSILMIFICLVASVSAEKISTELIMIPVKANE